MDSQDTEMDNVIPQNYYLYKYLSIFFQVETQLRLQLLSSAKSRHVERSKEILGENQEQEKSVSILNTNHDITNNGINHSELNGML